MALSDCPPSFRIVKLGNPDAERNAINAALQAIVRCLGESSIPDQTGHGGEFLTTNGSVLSWASVSGGSGTVTSAAVSTGTSGVAVTGSPITTSGTIDLDLGTLANVDDAPSDGTTYGRLNGAWAAAGGITYTDTGITIVGGSKAGQVIDIAKVANTVDGICTGSYDYSTIDDWQLWVFPTPSSGTFTLDVRIKAWSNTLPTGINSVCASAFPTIAGNGVDFTATGPTSTWTGAPIDRGDMLSVVPTTNTASVSWWSLYIPARRTF